MRSVSKLYLPVLLAVTLSGWVTASRASGLNLSWDDCGTAGALVKHFACNTNAGVDVLVGSCIAPVAMPQLNGQEGVLDMEVQGATLPNWWLLGASPNCRPSSALSIDFNFLADTGCADPWQNTGFGGINYTANFGGIPNRSRIRTVYAISPSSSIDATTEFYLFKIFLTHVRTVGTDSCEGCNVGATISFTSIKLTQPLGVGNYTISSPIHRNYVIWQSHPTPTRPTTWGSVKSLYR